MWSRWNIYIYYELVCISLLDKYKIPLGGSIGWNYGIIVGVELEMAVGKILGNTINSSEIMSLGESV